MIVRNVLAVAGLTGALLAVAAPAYATSLTYEPELVVSQPTTTDVRVDFGLAVHVTSSPVGDHDVCATDKAVYGGTTTGAGIEGGTTGNDC